MRIRGLKIGQRSLLLGGAMAVGAFAGCQTSSPQFSHPGVARGDAVGSPTSPAFAQVAAGTRLANNATMTRAPLAPAGMNAPSMVEGQGMMMQPMPQPMMNAATPGPNGMIYAVGYPPSGVATPPVQTMPMQPMPTPAPMPVPIIYPQQPQAYQQQMMMPPQGQMQVQPSMTLPAGTNPPTVMLINGPNGPQYVMVESLPSNTVVAPQVATQVLSPPQPVAAAIPAPLPPAAPAPTTAFAAPAPAPVAAPAHAPVTAAEPVPPAPPPAAPTFIAPPPYSVPLPSIPAPAVTPIEMGMKTPDPLPSSVNVKPPTGPVLPVSNTSGPSLGAFPPVPTTAPAPAVKLPPATGVLDDEIPAAPVFVPMGR